MANIAETDNWPGGVYQYADGDVLEGGPDSSEVLPLKQLAQRSLYQRLRNVTPWDDALAAEFGYPNKACVMHGGVSWRAIVANNVEPGTDGTKWERWGYTLQELEAYLPKLGSTTFWVRTDGNDANDGAENSAGSAFATLNRAFEAAAKIYAPGGTININLGIAGTYAAASPRPGSAGKIVVTGSVAAQDTYIITGGVGLSGVIFVESASIDFEGVRLVNSANTTNLLAVGPGGFAKCNHTTFASSAGASTQSAVTAFPGGVVTISTGCKVASNFGSFMFASNLGAITYQTGTTVEFVGNPAFSLANAYASEGGRISMAGGVHSGAATGYRYQVINGGGISTAGGGANFIPGSIAGFNSGGYYS